MKVSEKLFSKSGIVMLAAALILLTSGNVPISAEQTESADPQFSSIKGTGLNTEDQNFGRVEKIGAQSFPGNRNVYFKLTGGMTAMNPIDGWYFLDQSADKAIDLLYKAAENRWVISVRTAPELDIYGYAETVILFTQL